jgi:hypothetical protein
MNARDFAYFAQGFFELNDGAKSLTEAQAKQLYKKAESVVKGQGGVEDKAQEVVDYTKGLLFFATQNHPNSDVISTFLSSSTKALKEKLNDLFVHAIDPTVPGDQQQLRDVHNPKRPPPSGGLERMC